MKPENVTLYFKQGTSDRVYHASLEEAAGDRYVVNYANDRCGATHTCRLRFSQANL